MPHKWLPISKLNPEKGSRPSKVQFPDNSVVLVRWWRGVLVEVVNWLWKNGHLREKDCPIETPKNITHYVVHTEPLHPYGKRGKNEFWASEKVGNLYVEKNSNPKGIANGCRTVIQHVGQDPAQFKVRFSPPRT